MGPLAGWQVALRPGAHVVRRGNGRWSGYFAGASGDEGFFSHVGLLVGGADGWQVVHTEADDDSGIGGVRTDGLGQFLADAHGVAVVRPRLDAAQSARTLALARDPAWQAIPFDARFRLDDGGEAMYCTEWIQALVLAATGEDIARPRSRFGHIEIISIDDLRLSARVEPVFDHRLLPPGR
ncbi:hypothetical protein [Arenimonas sp.]|uniref:hypothetical protein n=1 Tax=Arenimonas sp. TaxID=1872635 RepID=UPI0035ADDBBA